MKSVSLVTKLSLIAVIVLLSVSSCIFSPKSGNKDNPVTPVIKDPITPEIVIENLQAAFNLRDADLYEKILHENFYYQYTPEYDDHPEIWTRTQEIDIMRNMFAELKEIVVTPSLVSTHDEYGINMENIPPGAVIDSSGEHPDEKWVICNYYITMDIFFQELGDFKVQQDMQFKMVEDPDTNFYSIIRWVDDDNITE